MADCGATGAAETGVNKAAIPITVAAKVIFVSMVFTLLALGRPASSIRAHLCMSSLNSTATDGSSDIHHAGLPPGEKAAVSAALTGISPGTSGLSQGAGASALTPPPNTSI